MPQLFIEHDNLIDFITKTRIEKGKIKTFQPEKFINPEDLNFMPWIYEQPENCPEYWVEVETLFYRNLEFVAYFNALSDLRDKLFAEINKNLEYIKSDGDGIEYIEKLKKDYTEILEKFSYEQDTLIRFQIPEMIEDLIKEGLDDKYEESVTKFFRDLCDFLRDLDKNLDELKVKDKLAIKNLKASELNLNKVVWHGNGNQLVDIFYRLKNELKTNYKNSENHFFLEGASDADIVKIIQNNFLTKDKETFSEASILTILKPSRQEKRPSNPNQIDLNPSIS